MKRVLFFTLCIIICMYAASIEDGIIWLRNKQNPDGSWGNSDRLGFLETVEVLNTFIVLGETTGVEQGLNYLENRFPENTDFMSRKLSLFAITNRDFYYLQQRLLSRKNTVDGGYGFSQNYQSSIWETILSVGALKDAGLDINELLLSLDFILDNQNTDGGYSFFFIGDSSRTLATAHCTYILSDFRAVSGVNPAINRSVDWLLQTQHPDSGFGDEGSTIYETAIAWLTLRSVDMGNDARKKALQYIASRQDVNGSWDNSIHNTALALRVIQEGIRPNLFTNSDLITFIPEQPNKGDTVLITARVVNNGDGESPAAVVNFSYSMIQIGEDTTSVIVPQDTVNVEILWPTEGIAGLQTITINIDPENLIRELNEDDNIASRQIFVQDTLPPETLDVWVSNPYFSPNDDGIKDYTRIYFTASEDVTVDIFVRDQDLNSIKTIISNEFYGPGRHSVVWNGTTDEGSLAQDADYLFEVQLLDMGNNLEIRNAFVCVDLNKTTIFASLYPDRIKIKTVFDGYLQQWTRYCYYPETDQFFFITEDDINWEFYYLITSNAARTYWDTLDQTSLYEYPRGFRNLDLISSQQKLFYQIGREWWDASPIFEYDLNTHTKTIAIEDSCYMFATSPDGGKTAYWLYDEVYLTGVLYLANSDGTDKIVIQEDFYDDYWNSLLWSSDGQYLLYYFSDWVSGNEGLWKVDRNGNKIFLLDSVFRACPSNDGSRVAFVKGDCICLMNPDGTNFETLAELPEIPTPPPYMERIDDIKWHPDDSEILVSTELREMGWKEGKIDTLMSGNYRIDISTKEIISLNINVGTEGGVWTYHSFPIDYSDNGKRIVYFKNNYFMTCNLLGEERDTIFGQDDIPGGNWWRDEWPIDFNADYCAMIPTSFHYGFSLNNLIVEITSLSRLAQTPDMLTIFGTVCDRNFEKFTVEYGIGQTPSQFFPLYEGNYCVYDTIITAWVPPRSGYYAVKLNGIDKAGNSLSNTNVINWDWETVITDLRAIPDFISPDGDGINDSTIISYYLVHPEPLNFTIRKDGQVYKNFYEHHEEPGSYSFTWNGTDNAGQIVDDGTYYLRIFGMSVPIVVDSAYPIAQVGAASGFIGYQPVFAVNGLAYDGNFAQFTLEYAHKDTSEFTTLLVGNHPVFIPDTIKLPDTLVYLDLRNCIGMNHLRMTAEDRAGHQKIAQDSVFADSLAVGCYAVLFPQDPRKIYFAPVIAMACLPNISEVEFSFRPISSDSFLEIGSGEPYPGEDYLYYRNEIYVADSSIYWIDTLAWVKCEVDYENGHLRKDSTLIRINGMPGETVFLRIDNPSTIVIDTPHVSGIVPVEANYYTQAYGGEPISHPECLDKVWFYYFDSDWHNIGAAIESPPFQTDWVTMYLPDGVYKLKAVGLDTLSRTLSHEIFVYVDNSTPYVNFMSPQDGEYVEDVITINVEAFPHPIAAQFGATIDYVIIQFIAGSDTLTLVTDSVAPYSTQFTTTDYPDANYKLGAIAYDTFGHKASTRIGIHIDNSPPVTLITEPLDGSSFSYVDTIDVSGKVFDQFIYRYYLKYQKPGNSWQTIISGNSNIEGLVAHWDVRTLASGEYNLMLCAHDHIGHADTSMIGITIENSPAPIVLLTNPIPNSFIKDACPITGKVQDDDLVCWVLSYGIGITPSEWMKIDSANYNFEGQFALWDTKPLEDTTHTIKLWAIDEIGRTNETKIIITVDNTLPLASIIEPQHEQYVGGPIPIIGTASDRNFVDYVLEVGEGVNPNFWVTIETGTEGVIEDTLGQLNPLPGTGWWTVKLSVEDKAENISQRQVSIIIDTLPPAPPIGLALQDSLQQIILTWEPNTEPDLAGYNAYRQGSKINETNIPSPFYLDSVFVDGHYTYYVTALDQFDLESEPSDTVSIDIDLTAPVVAIYYPQDNQRIHGTIDIQGTANDNHFRFYKVEVGQGEDPEEWIFLSQSYTPVIMGKLATWNTDGLDSTWTVQLKAEDTFGNKDSTRVVVFVDNIPPLPPQGLTATTSQDTVKLSWLPNSEPDLAGYRLFRNGTLVNYESLIVDTFYIETRPDGIYRYYLIAVDLAENKSDPGDSVTVEIDVRAPHAVITEPQEGERVAGEVNIRAEVEDNDVKSVTFEFKPELNTWEVIDIDSTLPFAITWDTDTLDPGKYYLMAIAKDFHNNVDPAPESIYVFVVKDLDPPLPPQGLVASLSNDTTYIDWLPNTEPDLAGYNVYQHEYGTANKLNSDIVTDTHFVYHTPYNQYYYFSITALDTAANESEHSEIIEVDCKDPVVSISKPNYGQRVKGVVPIIGDVYDGNLDHYVVSYGIDWNPAEWETLAVDSQNVFNDTLVMWYTSNLPDSFYTIKLEAIDEFNNHSYRTVTVYVDHTPPAPPQNLAATINPDSSIHLQWDSNTEPDLRGYNAYYSFISGSGYVKLNTEIIEWPGYDTELPGGRTYYFVVTAIDSLDNESGYSNEDSITPPAQDIDLAITEQDIIVYPPSPVEDDTALIVANVHNLGTHEVANVECDFYIKYQGFYSYLGMVTIPKIPANSSTPASVSWQTSGYAGTDTVCVFVDPNDRIIETDEENNDAFKEVIVRPSDIVFSIALDDTIYEPHTDLECQLRIVNLSPKTLDFLTRLSILDSLGDTLNSIYDIESFVYVDDTIPQGAIPFGDFYWDTTLYYKGTKSIAHDPQTGEYEYGFQDAQEYLSIQTDQAIIHYVYLDEENIPSEIMLEFENDQGSKEHRAYWGANLINRGTNNTESRRYLGTLPQPGTWVRLVVPAGTIGLADAEIKGISYVLYNGQANWDVLDLGLRNFEFSLGQGDSLVENLYWNTKNTPGGIYEFLTSLSFNSETMFEKQTFRILGVPGIIVDIHTDQMQYTSYEDVTITSVVTNQSPNYTYYDIIESIVLVDTLGTVFYDTMRTIDVLLPQTFIQTEFYWNTGYTPPGTYKVFDYIIIDNDTLAIDSSLFYITPSGGSEIRLSGTVKAEPKIIPYPDSFIVHYQVMNIGNIDLDSLPVRTQIIDGETFDTLVTYIDTLSLLVNETKYDTFPLSSADFTLKPYALTLDALIEDTVLNIAVAGFTIIDVSPPVIISISPTGVVSGTITIQAQISDDLSGVDSAFYRISGDYTVLARISGDSLLGVYTAQFNTLTLADGDYYLNVKARDNKNNETVDSVVITVDNTPPEISITGVSDSTYYNVDVTPVITISEPNLDSTAILLNGSPFVSGTTITDDGEYTLYVYALDLAGNDADTSLFFVIDKTPPDIAISGVADSTWYNHDVTPVITITDVYLDSSYISLNGQPFESGTTVMDEGEYTLYAWAIDKATNAADTSIYFVIDKTPPDPPIMVSPPESTTVAYSPITIEGLSEPYSFVNLNIGGTLYDTIANNLSQFTLEDVSLASGWNLLKFTARDKAGNVSDTAYNHLNLGVGIELEASIYIPQKFARILVFAKDDSSFVKSVLDSIEVFYKLVNNRQDFEDEFHSGIYNLYLIAGENCELHPHIQDEIVEMVNIGDGFVVTTWGTQHMHKFEEVFSVKFKGHIPANKIESIMFHESPISQPDTLSISAKVVKFEVINATLAAEFNTGNPAAVTNEYGDGRAVFFGFDMTDVESGIEEYLANAITYTTPDTSGVYPGATIPVEISIKNLSPEQRLNVVEVVPENFIIIAALDSGEISGPTITWNFPILQDSTEYLRSILKLPTQEFTDTISAEISYLSEGNYVPYDILYLEISTVQKNRGTLHGRIDKIIQDFNSISHEHMPRDTIFEMLHRLKEARNLLPANKQKSIENLMVVTKQISSISEFVNMRKEIDLIIKRIYPTSIKGEK